MRASLHQIVLVQETDFNLGGLTVCPSKRLVIAGEERELLQPRIMQVLVALARRRGEVVSRDELMASCWGGFAVSDDAIHRCIARIRRLSEAYGGFQLETVPRIGYQLSEVASLASGEVEVRPEAVEAAVLEPSTDPMPISFPPAHMATSWMERRSVIAAAGFIAGVLVTAASFVGAHLL